MSDASDWLPDLMLMANYQNWPHYLDALYKAFEKDFVQTKPRYPSKRFALKRHPISQGKEATFWHLIQEGSIEDDRTPDLRRCERIRWPRPVIEAIETKQVRVWRNVRGSNCRIVIAVEDFSYVVILDEREDYVLLWTAYWVEHTHRRAKLQREWEAWEKSQNS